MKKILRKKRKVLPDLLYNSLEVSKFINIITISGKKSKAKTIVYKAFNYIKKKFKKNPLKIFALALDNVAPMIEIKSKKIAASNYTIPVEIKNSRRITLSMKWIKIFSKLRRDKCMYLKLANELLDASNKKGFSYKKKKDIHKIAESNRAYSYYN